MFVLLVISVMIVMGTYLLNSITNFYHEEFIDQMDRVFQKEDFHLAAATANTLEEKLKLFIGQLGIDSYRDYYILNSLGGYMTGSRQPTVNLEPTPNIISAMAGQIGKEVTPNDDYIDYAVPIFFENPQGNVKYVIYIRDTKEELKSMTSEINFIIISALFFGLVISIGLGFLLSNTITTPIAVLTRKAEKMAAGDFEHTIEVKSKDEIGKLTNAFNNMAAALKKNLEKIASEKNKMEAIFLHMTDGIMAFNLEGEIIHINLAAKRMLGFKEDRTIHFDDYFKKVDASITLGDLIYLDHTNTLERQLEINGLHLKAFFVTFKLEQHKPGGVVVVLQDVTEQQKLEGVRREFVANVSHELKTPLTSIKSYAETLLGGALDDRETATHFLNVINNESDRMTRLVRDLLVLSRLDYEQTEWKKALFSLPLLIEEVTEKLSLSAKSRNHRLTFALTNEIPEIYADRDKIEQVLMNIVSNAIKYTPEGGEISIFAGCIYNEVYIKIKDNGIGIPKADLSRIFERFYRVDKARSRELGGTGLGLAIAREIVTAHDGTIDINSEQDQGTEIVIKIPTPAQ